MLVFMKWPTKPAPVVTLTFSGFHKLNAFTGAADQDRHALQWQYPIASGVPFTSISELKDVRHLQAYDEKQALVLSGNSGAMDLRTIALP